MSGINRVSDAVIERELAAGNAHGRYLAQLKGFELRINFDVT